MVRTEEEGREEERTAMSVTNAMLSGHSQAQEAAAMVSALSHVVGGNPSDSAPAPAWHWQTMGSPFGMPSSSSPPFGGGMNYYHGYVHEDGSQPYDQQYKSGS